MTLARDIDTRDPLDVRKDEWFADFIARKDEIAGYCSHFKRHSQSSWLLTLNTGMVYIYVPRIRRMRCFNGDKVMFMGSIDELLRFIVNKEDKAFNKIRAARESRESDV